jgi:DNA repair protein RecN (Recombination protein N)
MLIDLRIENFAIIDQLEVHFEPGLITFTGETGAGKSIIIDAVETLLGGRADATQVRSGSERASVDGVFSIPAAARIELLALLQREDLLDDPEHITLSREIRLNGRNVARLNGRSVNASLLREVGEYLIDVHGQSEHLSLLHVSQHLILLDRYMVIVMGSGASELLSNYSQTYQSLHHVQRKLDALRQAEKDAARRADILAYQVKEIEAARLRSDEEEELRQERNRLANAESLASFAQQALSALDEGTPEAPAAADLSGQALRHLTGLARIDPAQASLQEQAETLAESLRELSARLRDYLEQIEFNPRRLDQVEERLSLIQSLKRKYGDSIQAVLEFADSARSQLDDIAHSGELIEELEAEQTMLLEQLGRQGEALSQARNSAAATLESSIETELKDLQMSGARFKVEFKQSDDPQGAPLVDGRRLAYYANGLEKVEFLIAPNPGEGFKPLAKIASGGETSRLMLAMKNVLAKADHIPTLIFDEIDQGIGGRVGTVVGEKLWSLARQHQVVCITHLPQLAAFGEQHLHVEKKIEAGRTITQLKALEGEARVRELALMLGTISEGTLRSAAELIQFAEKRTNTPS